MPAKARPAPPPQWQPAVPLVPWTPGELAKIIRQATDTMHTVQVLECRADGTLVVRLLQERATWETK